MIRRILFTILGAMLCFFTAPAAMAAEAAQEGIRADFFVAAPDEAKACSDFLAASDDDEAIGADDSSGYEFGGEDGRRAAASFGDLGLAEFPECGEESESSVESKNEEAKREQKRAQRRTLSSNSSFLKCRFIVGLSPEVLAKGVAKHPATQDAGEQRTAAIRYLQIQALVS